MKRPVSEPPFDQTTSPPETPTLGGKSPTPRTSTFHDHRPRPTRASSNHFPLVSPPPARSRQSSCTGKTRGPPLPPKASGSRRGSDTSSIRVGGRSNPPQIEWAGLSQHGFFTGGGPPSGSRDVDVESLGTVSTGSSRESGSKPTSSYFPTRNSSISLSSRPSTFPSPTPPSILSVTTPSSASPNPEPAFSSPPESHRNSISSSIASRRSSIAPSLSLAPRASLPFLATPQSIFQHPEHRFRPLSDLLPRFLRKGTPSAGPVAGVGGRAKSTSILDAALATSASGPRERERYQVKQGADGGRGKGKNGVEAKGKKVRRSVAVDGLRIGEVL